MTSQDMSQDTDPGEDDDVVVAELVDEPVVTPRVPVVGVDPEYVALYRRLRAEGGVDLAEQLHDRYLQLARGGVTPSGLPYPSPTDPVAEGADAIRALAEALDTKLRDSGWVAPTLNEGYTINYALACRRIGGIVYWRGAVGRDAGNWPTSGAAESVMTLPPEFRPASVLRVALGAADARVGSAHIATTGGVSLIQVAGPASTLLYLSGISYVAA